MNQNNEEEMMCNRVRWFLAFLVLGFSVEGVALWGYLAVGYDEMARLMAMFLGLIGLLPLWFALLYLKNIKRENNIEKRQCPKKMGMEFKMTEIIAKFVARPINLLFFALGILAVTDAISLSQIVWWELGTALELTAVFMLPVTFFVVLVDAALSTGMASIRIRKVTQTETE